MSDNFLSDFDVYEEVCPVGVRLPEIEIEPRYYEELKCPDDISNYEFYNKLLNRFRN